jgi:hypothetical protein
MGAFDGELAFNLTNETVGDTLSVMGSYRDFDDALLAALAQMAVRSHRRQADLDVAVRRAGLLVGPDRLRAALQRLQDDGCVERVVPLADGGVLVSVTGRGIERLSHTSRRHVVLGD